MLSHNQSFQKESQNCSLSKIPSMPEQQQCMTTQFNIPRQSKIELVTKDQKNYFPEILKIEENQSKKGLSRKQKIIISVSLLLVLSGILAGFAAYQIFSDQNDSKNSTPHVPVTYAKYESQITAGQQNNLIQIIHVPQTQRIYQYEIVNNRILQNIDNSTESSSLPSSYQFGIVCLNVNETEFDMILYFIKSQITLSQNSTLQFQDYPQAAQDNNQESADKNANTASHYDSSNLNQLSNLSEQEIEILKQKNIDPQDFLNSYLPIIRFSILKSGQIGQIQKPLNMRYDLQQIILNVLEQMSPIVLKNYYNVYETQNNGNKRMLKRTTLQYTKRVLNNENVPVNLEASVSSNLAGQISKSYSDLQDDSSTSYQTSYSQQNSIQNGAIKSSDVHSVVKLQPNTDGDSDLNQQIFQGMKVQSEGKISFVSQQDKIDPQFLQQLTQDQEQMLKLNLSWKQAQDLQNKVQQYENEKDLSSNAGRLLQSQSQNSTTVGKAIYSNIYKNSFASIDLQSDYYSQCERNSALLSVNCYSGFIGKFQSQSQQLQSQNISQIYSNGAIDKSASQLNYVKNNVFKLMGDVTQQISSKVQTATNLINSLISRSSSFQNSIVQNLNNTVNQNTQTLNNTINGFNEILNNYVNSMINQTASIVNKYNESILFQFPTYQNILNTTFQNTLIEFNSRVDKLRAFINKVVSNNLALLPSTQSLLKNLTIYEIDYFARAFNQTEQAQPGYIVNLYPYTQDISQYMLQNTNVDILNSFIANYSSVWTQIAKNVTTGTSTTLLINIKNNLQTILAQQLIRSSPSAYLASPFQNFYNQAMYVSSLYDIHYTDNSNNFALSARNDTELTDKILLTQTASELDNEAIQIKNLFDTPIDYRSTYSSFLNAFYASAQEFTNEEQAVRSQYRDQFIQWANQVANYTISFPKLLQEANLNVINSLNQTIPNVQSEYDSQTAFVESSSTQLLSQIGSIYDAVNAFLSNTTYPDNDPLNSQTPPADSLFNSTVFGITNEYLVQQINELSNLLPQLNTVIDNLTSYGPQISTVVGQMVTFLQNYKVTYPQAPQAIFTTTFVSLYKSIFTSYSNGFLTDQNKALNNLNLDTAGIANIQQFKNRINSFVSVDVQNTFTQSILLQQSSMSQLYNTVIQNIQKQKPVSSTKNNFGDLKTVANPNQQKLLSQNYTYVYPCPLGFSIKLNLQVNWTTAIKTTLITQNDTLSFQTLSSIRIQSQGTFSALFFVIEVGGYTQGTFLNATLNSTINTNITDNTGKNTLIAQYGANNVQIEQYFTVYLPKIVVVCDSDNDDNKNNSSYKSSILSTYFSDSYNFCGTPIKQKCKTVIQTIAQQINILSPINFKGNESKKTLVNQSY